MAQTVSESVMSEILGPYTALLAHWSLLPHPTSPKLTSSPQQEVAFFNPDKAVVTVASHRSLISAAFN